MNKIGLSFEQVVEIYSKHGHQIKQPASVKAITEIVNVIAAQIMDNVNERFNEYFNALLEIDKRVAQSNAPQVKRQGGSGTSGRVCYCGTVVLGSDPCGVCGSRA
jgi:hypothetical protein